MSAWKTICPGCFVDKGEDTLCKHCSYDEDEKRSALLLPHRSLLSNQYLVGRILGKPGGFGITYLAWDTTLETRVAIKEYLPREVAGRETDRNTVMAHSRDDEELFKFGLNSFLKEARILAKFNHPNVMRVRGFFEENGTAYLVMDYYQGKTLEEYLQQKGNKLPVKTAIYIIVAILDGLKEVHQKGFLHRDIKPHNIYLTKDKRVILLDFGAARHAMGERSRSMSSILTPGFAPFEQYHRRGEQGPWTDLYACGATLYYLITGQIPPEATERMERDELVPPERLTPGLSPQISAAILQALSPNPKKRPQNVQAFQNMLVGDGSSKPEPREKEDVQPSRMQPPAAPAQNPRMQPQPQPRPPQQAAAPGASLNSDEGLKSNDKTWIFLGNVCISPLLGVILYFVWKDNKPKKSKEVCTLTWKAVAVWVVLFILYIIIIIAANV